MSEATKVELGSKYLDCTVADHVMRLRIARPEKKNAFTQSMYRGIKRAAILADGDPQVDILLITGTDTVFASGGDMSAEMEDAAGLALELDPSDQMPHRHLERCSKVVLAAVNGLCYAGGLDIVLFSDLSIASDRATFRIPELQRGVPDPWIAARLADYIGLGRAKYYAFTAAKFDAHEAFAMGLVGRVVPHAEFEQAVQEVVEQIQLSGPKTRMTFKDEINRHLTQPNMNMFKRSILSPEMIEGMKAFLEKRPPNWSRD